MTRKRTLSAFAVILGLTLAIPASADACRETPAPMLSSSTKTDAIRSKNLGERSVRVKRGKYSYIVPRGDTYTLNVDDECIKGWFGGTTANYETPAPDTAECREDTRE